MIPFSDEQIAKYLSNELTEREKEKIDEWKSASASNRTQLESIISLWDTAIKVPEAEGAKPNWNAFEATYIKKQDSSYLSYIATAACIVIAVFFGFFNSTPNVTTAETLLGETKTIQLSDGSTIRLNYLSQIEYHDFSDANERRVKLRGEAFFEVASDKTKPFIIETNESVTTVLGTKFHLKSRKEKTELVVTEGKVSFENPSFPNQKRILTKGQKSAIHKGKQPEDVSDANLTFANAWLKNQLIFKQTRLSKIVSEIETIYNTKITLKSSLNETKVTAVIHYKKPLDKVIENLTSSIGLSYKKQGDRFFITD